MGKKVEGDTSLTALSKVDPATFELLRSILEYAADHMSMVLQRAPLSLIVADMVDFLNAIYDYGARVLSQATNCQVHLAAMKSGLGAVVVNDPPDSMRPGDVVVKTKLMTINEGATA